MKKSSYLLACVVILSAMYGAYSTVKMLFYNRAPYSISCEGLLLARDKVYALSNKNGGNSDTVFFNFENSAALMPRTLGFVYYDKSVGGFVVRNDSCIINPTVGKKPNPFFPYCHTINSNFFQKGRFFGPNEIIPQTVLCNNGIKYNIPSGSTETRVSVELVTNQFGVFLKMRDEGIKVKYPVPNVLPSYYSILFNKKSNDSNHYQFSFSHLLSDTGVYKIKVTPGFQNARYQLFDETGKLVKESSGRDFFFTVGQCLFRVAGKYSLSFTMFYVLFLSIVICFQFFYLLKYHYALSPIVKSIFALRIVINAIVFMAIPLFLTSYPIHDNRIWYLILILILNFYYFMYFIPAGPAFLRRASQRNNSRKPQFPKTAGKYFLWLLILVSPILFWRFARNEAIFQIPIGHFQKGVIIILFYLTRNMFDNLNPLNNVKRIVLIIGYSLLISLVTSDLGSFIYATLAITLIELIRKTLKLKWFLFISSGLILAIILAVNISPSLLEDRKMYRLAAPYIQPDDPKLALVNEGDKESYSTFIITLKSVLSGISPGFNELNIPSNSRSTFHTDFAFLWGLTFGHFSFFILYLAITGVLLYYLLFLTYVSIRSCKINSEVSFLFPKSSEAEAIRFLLAYTLISFIVPICSNLLLIPVTGVSIPAFSISWVEILFLIILLVALEYIFNNKEYYVNANVVSYHYSDLHKSVKWGLSILASCFLIMVTYKGYSLNFNTPNTFLWKKRIVSDESNISNIPKEKDSLVSIANNIIGNDDLISVKKSKKNLLKNLASIYYINIPYNETRKESGTYSINITKLQRTIDYDSVFSFKKMQLSGQNEPFGKVFAFGQLVNNKPHMNVGNQYYTGYDIWGKHVNSDLHAECSKALENHLGRIGINANIGSIMIVNNNNGGIIASSSFPFGADINSKDVYYFPGSLKKIVLAYAALKISPEYYSGRIYRGVTFSKFIKSSDDHYAANLLREILQKNEREFQNVLIEDFGLPLFSTTEDAYFDVPPHKEDFTKDLDRNNILYRIAIGQEKPYQFMDVIQWYSRIASLKKLHVCYEDTIICPAISISQKAYSILAKSMNGVLFGGTANKVRLELQKHHIPVNGFICKTGTAEAANGKYNSSSSFIIANKKYTIGIMLKGNIPDNGEGLAAKDLFNSIIPILIKYGILEDAI